MASKVSKKATMDHMKNNHKEDWENVKTFACALIEAFHSMESTRTKQKACELLLPNLPCFGIQHLANCKTCNFTFSEAQTIASVKSITDYIENDLKGTTTMNDYVNVEDFKRFDKMQETITRIGYIYDKYNPTSFPSRSRGSHFNQGGIEIAGHVVKAVCIFLAILFASLGWAGLAGFFAICLALLEAQQAYSAFCMHERRWMD